MRFEEAYGAWSERRLTQEEAAQSLGVCERTFRRYIDRYEEEGLAGLVDKRLAQGFHHRRRRERTPLAGMMLHQGGPTHRWVEGKAWDLVVTMDDATSEVYSGFSPKRNASIGSLSVKASFNRWIFQQSLSAKCETVSRRLRM